MFCDVTRHRECVRRESSPMKNCFQKNCCTSALLTAVALMVAGLCVACTSEKDRVYAEAKRCAGLLTRSDDCSAAADRTAKSPAQPKATGPEKPGENKSSTGDAEQSRVYIDATESMRGFVSSPNSSFSRLIESLSYAMPGTRLFKYGINGRAGKAGTKKPDAFARQINFSQELRKSSFYDLGFNQDELLFDFLAAEEHPARSVLITDGVYSSPQSELESQVVVAINKWIENGHFFGILGFSSPFGGKIYSENSRGWVETNGVTNRPFYAFVFSPNEAGFRELKEKLARDFTDMVSWEFPPEAASCSLDPMLRQGLERKDLPPSNLFYLFMYGSVVFDAADLAQFDYELRCLPARNYPVSEFGFLASVKSFTWDGTTFRKSQTQPRDNSITEEGVAGPLASPSQAATPVPSATQTVAALSNFKLRFPRKFDAAYTLFRVSFQVSSKSLQSSIRERNTEDDSLPEEAGKTFRFYEFMSALSTAHLKNSGAVRLPLPVFLALTNK